MNEHGPDVSPDAPSPALSPGSSTLPPTTAIADVEALWGLDGWLTPPLVPIVPPATVVAGRARTVRLRLGGQGGGMAPVFDLLSSDLEGAVLVLAGLETLEGSAWGEILTLAARQQGAAAALVTGAVRDVADLAALGLPVYGQGHAVAGPNGQAHVEAVDVPVTVGSVVVEPGDLVVGDAGGCVRIPSSFTDSVLAGATDYAAAEADLIAALRAGRPLSDAYALKRTAVEELRRQRP